MATQSYKNHIRFYPPHHFVFYPLIGISFFTCIVLAVCRKEEMVLWIAFAIMIMLLGWLSFMVRQHYALGNQNRIVRLEMRLRYFILTGKSFESSEAQLSFGQIAALRFCGDDELPALVQRAITENLSADDIKKAIRHWQPDYMRL